MPFAICRKRCFDGNLGRLYYPGDVVEDMPLKHPLASSFEFKKVSSPVVEEVKEEPEVVKRGPGRPPTPKE
jgi:hypothetical protein